MARKIRVLYIEDDRADQYIVQHILDRSREIEVDLVVEMLLSAGLERLANESFEVVILDLDLPDSSYWSPEQALKEMLLLVPETPVIVVSNNDVKGVQLRMIEVGAQDFVPKSELEDRLLTAIEFAIVRAHRIVELRQAAMHDDLTGLYNSRGFRIMWSYQRKVADRQQKRLSLIAADVNGLKEINDSCGHLEGNLALKKVAEILNANTRPDDILSRPGGDEFLVLTLRDPSHRDDELIERFRQAFDRHNADSGKPYILSVSFGASALDAGSSLEAVVDRADRKMYEDKAEIKRRRGGSGVITVDLDALRK